MRKQEFLDSVQFTDEKDYARADRALCAKGVEQHIILRDYLLTLSRNKNKPLRYTEVASVYRYDKRIRNCLAKYLSFLEEYYRGIILDNYRFDTNKSFWSDRFKKILTDNEPYELNDILTGLGFGDLLIQIRGLSRYLKSDEIRGEFIKVNKDTRENLFALNGLRNAVMHNKFLLMFKGYEDTYADGVSDASLRANISNLLNHLPAAVREDCIRKLNECSQERDNDDKTKWDLPKTVILEFAENTYKPRLKN